MDRYLQLYGPWGEYPRYPVDDWKSEVANDHTRLGYWQWVESREAEIDPEQTGSPLH